MKNKKKYKRSNAWKKLLNRPKKKVKIQPSKYPISVVYTPRKVYEVIGKLYVSEAAEAELASLWYWGGSRTEMNGIGYIEVLDDGFRWTKAYHLTQLSSPGGVASNPDKEAEVLLDIMGSGLNPQDLRLYWHFHPGAMGAFWSVTDDTAAREEVERASGNEIINFLCCGGAKSTARLDKWEDGILVRYDLEVIYDKPRTDLDFEREFTILRKAVGDLPRVATPYGDGGWVWSSRVNGSVSSGADRNRAAVKDGVCPECLIPDGLDSSGEYTWCAGCGYSWYSPV